MRKYCYECKYWSKNIKDKPCNTCIPTKIIDKKIVDTYERKNFKQKM